MSKIRNYPLSFLILNCFLIPLHAESPKDICFDRICCINAPKPKAERDAEAYLFQPKQPNPLTQDEAAKSVRQRIQEKFTGKLPDGVDRLISLFTEQKNDSHHDASSPNRILLTGDTGTGKTYLAEVLIQELQVKSFSISGPSFGDKYCGETSRRIHEVFENAKALNEPVIIFIDYINALAFKIRNTSHPVYKRNLETLLTELENVKDNKNVFVIFATHEPDLLDKTFIDKFPGKSHAHLSHLNEEERAALFMKYFKDRDLPADSELAQELAKTTNTNGDKYISNRGLEGIVRKAKFKKVRDCHENQKCDEHIRTYLHQALKSMNKYS